MEFLIVGVVAFAVGVCVAYVLDFFKSDDAYQTAKKKEYEEVMNSLKDMISKMEDDMVERKKETKKD